MKRRQFLKYSASAMMIPAISQSDAFAGYVFKNPNDIVLTAAPTQVNLVPGKPATAIWGFKKKQFAPVIRAKQGENIHVRVKNAVDNTLGVHWHGIRLNNKMDGVPNITQKPIMRNESFQYVFSSPDAGTYWYHPHSNSIEQLGRGLVGPLIIEEETPYPADQDVVLLINDWRVNENMEILDNFYSMHDMLHDGHLGNLVTVNGTYNPEIKIAPNSRTRLRIINASVARFLSPEFKGLKHIRIIAIDGHPVSPRPYETMMLGPGMRVDLLADTDSVNQNLAVLDTTYRKPNNLFMLSVKGKPARNKPYSDTPPSLPKNPVPEPNLADAKVHVLDLDGGAMSAGMFKGIIQSMFSRVFWTINGESMTEKMEYEESLFTLKKGTSYRFKIKNNTRFTHPIHLHGHTFKILSNTAENKLIPYWSDTVMTYPGHQAEIAFVADNPGKWMLHCHVLDHQVSGMMGVIEVV